MKNVSDIAGIHNLKTLSSSGRKSIPSSPKSVFLDLYMRQSTKGRLLKEKERLEKSRKQIDQKLREVDRIMTDLLKIVTKTNKKETSSNPTESKNHTVLEY